MPNSEYLKMIELVQKLRAEILEIEGERSNTVLFRQANCDLQEIYNLHLKNPSAFSQVEVYLKNLYRSFNYAAAIVKDAIKRRTVKSENVVVLDEALDTMIRCCDVIISKLKNIK